MWSGCTDQQPDDIRALAPDACARCLPLLYWDVWEAIDPPAVVFATGVAATGVDISGGKTGLDVAIHALVAARLAVWTLCFHGLFLVLVSIIIVIIIQLDGLANSLHGCRVLRFGKIDELTNGFGQNLVASILGLLDSLHRLSQ